MVEVAVPDFVDGIADELGGCAFSGFVGGLVSFLDGMLSLPAGMYYCGGIVCDGGVCWWSGRNREGCAPCRCVGAGWFNESN
jgi:hypothetical protein